MTRKPPPPPQPKPAPLHERLERFVRDYTSGMDEREMRRLWDRDAPRVYRVLMRDRGGEPAPKGGIKLLLWRAKLLFLSVSEKLSPGRRAVFALSIVAVVLAAFGFELETNGQEWDFKFDASPLLFFLSVAGFAYLFASELVDRLLVRDEIEVARQLQRDLLPKCDPALPGWRFASAWRTANDVGGDWYGYDLEPNGQLRLAVADASGHGMAAALLVRDVVTGLRMGIERELKVAHVFRKLNRVIHRSNLSSRFVSVFYGELEASGSLIYVNAGHPPGLLFHAGSVRELATGGTVIGPLPQARFRRGFAHLEPGDVLVLCTDGVL
ncbi:MAG: PP2C family protein-serine/threonine phosphatase, partial [Myxococcota bacterium]